MDLEKLLQFIKTEHKRLLLMYGFSKNEELKYPITIKVMEEVGELAQEILTSNGIQRKEKLTKNQEEIENEIADVLITILLLAENTGVNVEEGLKKAIDKRLKRNY